MSGDKTFIRSYTDDETGRTVKVYKDNASGSVFKVMDDPTGSDTIDALKSELDTAIDLMVRVARGEQTIQKMGEWVSLNFPPYRSKLPESMRATPKK